MILRIPLLFEGSKASKNLYALFDSGASYSCINEDRAEELEIFTSLHTPIRLATASEHVFMEITNRITLDFYKDDIRNFSQAAQVDNHARLHVFMHNYTRMASLCSQMNSCFVKDSR